LASRKKLDDWSEEARRLRGLLDTVSTVFDAEYGSPLKWHDEDMNAEQWSDVSQIAALMIAERLTDDAGRIMKRGGASSVVQGYRVDDGEYVVNARWMAGGGKDYVFTCVFYFETPRPLNEHEVPWLVSLMNGASAAVEASDAQILTTGLTDELVDAELYASVGALTLIPHKIDTSVLPPSIATYPGPGNHPDSLVAALDLDKAVLEPHSVMPDVQLIAGLL
jgi:hypothetical protein